MMPPGHLAATWGVAALLQQNRPRLAHLDYRLLAVSAMLPDFIDKPLAIFVFTGSHSSQNIAHSFLLHILILTLTLLWWRRALPYALAFNAHLPADHMWNHTETFWWPLFGWTVFWGYKPMNTPEDMLNVYLDIIIRYPHVWVVEMVAVVVLVWFVRRYQLYHRPRLKQFSVPANFGQQSRLFVVVSKVRFGAIVNKPHHLNNILPIFQKSQKPFALNFKKVYNLFIHL